MIVTIKSETYCLKQGEKYDVMKWALLGATHIRIKNGMLQFAVVVGGKEGEFKNCNGWKYIPIQKGVKTVSFPELQHCRKRGYKYGTPRFD